MESEIGEWKCFSLPLYGPILGQSNIGPSSANRTLAHPQPILAWPINRRSVSLPISDSQLVLKRRLDVDLVVKFIGALLKLLQVRIS